MNHFAPVLLLAVASCGVQYANEPVTNAPAPIARKAAVEYAIPPNAPQGSAQIASYGLAEITPENAPTEMQQALHLRVILTDHAATPWSFDTTEQRVKLSDGEVLAPAFASTNRGTPPPLVGADDYDHRVVDLFFLLPPTFQNTDSVPPFDALWRVNTSAGVIVEQTPFDALSIEPDDVAGERWDYYGGDNYYWGGPYWVNSAVLWNSVPRGHFAGNVVIQRSGGHGGGAHGHGSHGGSHGGGHGGGGGGHR
jgi:uncharacterized membrane protein YgcG